MWDVHTVMHGISPQSIAHAEALHSLHMYIKMWKMEIDIWYLSHLSIHQLTKLPDKTGTPFAHHTFLSIASP